MCTCSLCTYTCLVTTMLIHIVAVLNHQTRQPTRLQCRLNSVLFLSFSYSSKAWSESLLISPMMCKCGNMK